MRSRDFPPPSPRDAPLRGEEGIARGHRQRREVEKHIATRARVRQNGHKPEAAAQKPTGAAATLSPAKEKMTRVITVRNRATDMSDTVRKMESSTGPQPGISWLQGLEGKAKARTSQCG